MQPATPVPRTSSGPAWGGPGVEPVGCLLDMPVHCVVYDTNGAVHPWHNALPANLGKPVPAPPRLASHWVRSTGTRSAHAGIAAEAGSIATSTRWTPTSGTPRAARFCDRRADRFEPRVLPVPALRRAAAPVPAVRYPRPISLHGCASSRTGERPAIRRVITEGLYPTMKEIIGKIAGLRVVVIGDMILDHYVW